jgi:hypothetical protein
MLPAVDQGPENSSARSVAIASPSTETSARIS